jgi:hypothetical protein
MFLLVAVENGLTLESFLVSPAVICDKEYHESVSQSVHKTRVFHDILAMIDELSPSTAYGNARLS